MQLARVEGNITSTVKHPSFAGWRLLICQPVDSEGAARGAPVVAIDPWGAGLHESVIVSTDGKAARGFVNDEKSPVRHMIAGIVDPKGEEPGGRESRVAGGRKPAPST